MTTGFTKEYRVCQTDAGVRVTFYCDLSHNGYTAPLIQAQSPEEALQVAQQEARRHFNRCHCCGQWVCDEAYNENAMMCVRCAPRSAEGRPEDAGGCGQEEWVCPACGKAAPAGSHYCTVCGMSFIQGTMGGTEDGE